MIIDENCLKKKGSHYKTSDLGHFYIEGLEFFFKKIAHKLYTITPTQLKYNIFSELRSKCKAQSNIDYNKYILETENSLISCPKIF